MTDFPFFNGDFRGRSPSFDSNRTVNLDLVPTESQSSRGSAMLLGTPGTYLWTNLAGGRIRGFCVFSPSIAIVVAGTNVWKLSPDKTAVNIGTVVDDSPTICMSSNGTVIMASNEMHGYYIDPVVNTVTPITNENWHGADRNDFLDGYLVFNWPGTGKFQITGLYSTDIDGLDFATAEGGPDNLVTLIVDHRELWLFGEDTTEVWYNVGNVDFPFQRIQGAFLEVGCAAAQSVAKADNSIFWLASDDRGYGTVQRASGYQPIRVSNHALEWHIAKYQRESGISDAQAYTYAQEGMTYYMLTFPAANATWCLNVATGLWHQRAYRDPTTAVLGRHRSNCQMNFAGLTLVGDYENGNIYVLDLDTYSDNGDPLPAVRACPHITNDGKRAIYNSLELFMQTGVGLSSGQGSDPQALLRWSNDGGYTWSNELRAPIGKIGERMSRVRFTRLGSARDRVFEVTVTDPIKRVFTAASLSTTACAT